MTDMSNYLMPEGMRPATLEERRQFYASEFDVAKVADWLRGRQGKTKFAVIMGKHTKIFLPEYMEDAESIIIIDEYRGLEDVRSQILDFLPEATYYDRNIYDAQDHAVGQELAFDLDPENITCPVHGTLADKMRRHQGLSFCSLELALVKDQTVRLYEHLAETYSRLRVVYSGRGFHIHVLDSAAYALTMAERQKLAAAVKRQGFEIDEWVTAGEMRLIRLPYSLHGMVSRLCLPLEKNEVENFDPIRDEKCIPRFLRAKPTSS
jgi:DNA primase catalytic subunit